MASFFYALSWSTASAFCIGMRCIVKNIKTQYPNMINYILTFVSQDAKIWRQTMMSIIKTLKGVLKKMAKVASIRDSRQKDISILAKRRLDFSYTGFISSAKRPPLASPSLAKNNGVEHSERVGRSKK